MKRDKVCCGKECDKVLTMKLNRSGKMVSNFQIDHIKPISADGTNEDSNLQCLCKECHGDKTAEEEHFSNFTTYSSFNKTTEELINSDFNKHYAFVERLVEYEATSASPLDFGLENVTLTIPETGPN